MYHLFPFVVLLDPDRKDDGSVVTIANGRTGDICYVSPYAKNGLAVMLGKDKAKLASLSSAPTGEGVLEELLVEWRGAIGEHQIFADLLNLVLKHGQVVRRSVTVVTAIGGKESYTLTVYGLGPYLFVVEDSGEEVMDPRLALHLILKEDTGSLLFVGPSAIKSVEECRPEMKELHPQVEGFDDPPIDTDTVKDVLEEVSRIVHPPVPEHSEGSA